MDRSVRCWTCGKPRGLSLQRKSWALNLSNPFVPRTDNPDDSPAQQSNDLICFAHVYRNGGTSEGTHLCDDCLRIGVRAIKVELDQLLEELGGDYDKDKEIVELTGRLANVQHRLSQACFEHNRMQERLKAILPPPQENESEATRLARWEVSRGRIEAFG